MPLQLIELDCTYNNNNNNNNKRNNGENVLARKCCILVNDVFVRNLSGADGLGLKACTFPFERTRNICEEKL